MDQNQQLETIFTLARELPRFKGIEDKNLREVILENYGNSSEERIQKLITNMEAEIAEGKQKVQNNVEKIKNLKINELDQQEHDEKIATELLRKLEKL